MFGVLADQKGSGIWPDEWITHCIFDDSCSSTLAANFRPLTFGQLLAQVLHWMNAACEHTLLIRVRYVDRHASQLQPAHAMPHTLAISSLPGQAFSCPPVSSDGIQYLVFLSECHVFATISLKTRGYPSPALKSS